MKKHNWLKQAEIEVEKSEEESGLAEEFRLEKARTFALISIAKSLEELNEWAAHFDEKTGIH